MRCSRCWTRPRLHAWNKIRDFKDCNNVCTFIVRFCASSFNCFFVAKIYSQPIETVKAVSGRFSRDWLLFSANWGRHKSTEHWWRYFSVFHFFFTARETSVNKRCPFFSYSYMYIVFFTYFEMIEVSCDCVHCTWLTKLRVLLSTNVCIRFLFFKDAASTADCK